jgi:hypothetical protein
MRHLPDRPSVQGVLTPPLPVIVVDVGEQVIVNCMAYQWPVGDILSFVLDRRYARGCARG